MKTYPTSNAEAQMTHAAWDAALPYDFEEEARSNPFLAVRQARLDANAEEDAEAAEDELGDLCHED